MKGRAALVDWSTLSDRHPELRVDYPIGRTHPPSEILGAPYEEPRATVLRLPGALVGPVGVIFDGMIVADDAHYLPPTHWRTAPWLPFELHGDEAHYRAEHVEGIEGRVLYVDALNGSRNFGHFVHDTLPYSAIQAGLQTLGVEVAALVPDWRFDSQRTLAARHFGRTEPRSDHWMQADELYLAQRQFRVAAGTAMNRVPVTAFRGLASADPDLESLRTAPDWGSPVYLWRPWGQFGPASEHAGRAFLNGAEVDAFLAAQGFLTIDCTSAPLAEVQARVACAPVVAGLHGAQMAHILWARPGARYLEMAGPSGCWRSLEAVAESIGVRTVRAAADAGPQGPAMPIERLAEALGRCRDAGSSPRVR